MVNSSLTEKNCRKKPRSIRKQIWLFVCLHTTQLQAASCFQKANSTGRICKGQVELASYIPTNPPRGHPSPLPCTTGLPPNPVITPRQWHDAGWDGEGDTQPLVLILKGRSSDGAGRGEKKRGPQGPYLPLRSCVSSQGTSSHHVGRG